MKKLLLVLSIFVLTFACKNDEKPSEMASSTDEIVKITTDFGEVYVLLYDETPLHKENFLKLAKEGFYDSTTFHRVIEGFMIQGGDPNSKDDIPFNDGQGGPGYTIPAEFNPNLIHKKGALAAARTGGPSNPEMRSSGSQFYIVQGKPVPSPEFDQFIESNNRSQKEIMIRDYVQAPENGSVLRALQRNQAAGRIDSVEAIIEEITPIATEGFVPKTYTPEQREMYTTIGGTPFLDDNYTVFGEVIKGLSVVDSITVQEKGEGDRPVNNIMMTVTVQTMDREEITTKFGYSYSN